MNGNDIKLQQLLLKRKGYKKQIDHNLSVIYKLYAENKKLTDLKLSKVEEKIQDLLRKMEKEL